MNKRMIKILMIGLFFPFFNCGDSPKQLSEVHNEPTGNEMIDLTNKLAKGWNTWNTRSVLSHVLLPESFAIDLQLKDNKSGDILKEALIGRRGDSIERVIPGFHAYDGSYTSLKLEWRDITVQVQSATKNDMLYVLVTPIKSADGDSLIINPKMLWEKEGVVSIDNNITAQTPSKTITAYIVGHQWEANSDTILTSLDQPIAISTDKDKSVEEIEKILNESRVAFAEMKTNYGESSELYNSMQSVLAWDQIYEPTNDRVITPVSRIWNTEWGGWVLFDWDTYFAAYMLSLDNKDLAYSNALAITKDITEGGFIPNWSCGFTKSKDRSQPPVGSYVIKQIYKQHKQKWLLHEVFNELLSWNRWWEKNRDVDGYLCWGSNPYDPGDNPEWLTQKNGKKQAALWESGLDNSPMYDDASFDSENHIMQLADVGLMSLYILDCQSLSEIAEELGKSDIAEELKVRESKYRNKLKTLWNNEFGLYLNKDLATGEFSYRLSPTLFYPLLAKVPDDLQANRMMAEHFYNPQEFWGEYILPSIARNDTAFKDNNYWRGRIWAPMNFLVYLGIRNYDLPKARKDIVEKSETLLLKSWIGENHIYENYNSETGQGDDIENSDKYYHWGALLSYIGLIEKGHVLAPELPIQGIN
ncbi:trehalase family glycosidase [uncultured Maribacter sp.]|uniref:MGH1-like glycoside hydrolase domain-containing protein n=1 Tax=uncultured Maribacter sp. TaxID=431308 RepID=UPI00260A3FFB|nr:trehalase family glycosidase [uncultured Maribacter sp.]